MGREVVASIPTSHARKGPGETWVPLSFLSLTMTDPKQTIEFFLGQMDEKLDYLVKHSADHGERIAVLERWKTRAVSYTAGAAGVVSVVVGIFHIVHG